MSSPKKGEESSSTVSICVLEEKRSDKRSTISAYDGHLEAVRKLAAKDEAEEEEEEALVSHDKRKDDDPVVGRRYNVAWFLLGCSQNLFWSGLLNSISDVTDAKYPQYPNLSDTISIAFAVSSFLCAIIAAKWGFVNLKLNISTGLCFTTLPIITTLVIQVCSGLTANVLFHICASAAGILLAFWQAGHFGLAAYASSTTTRWVAAGLGGSGIFTFAAYMLFTEAIFPDGSNPMGAMWGLQIVIAVMLLLSTLAVFMISRQRALRARFIEAKQVVRASRLDPDRPKLMSIFAEFWAPMVACAVVNIQTYWMYPNIAPFRWWQGTPTQTNLLVGAFQVGDCVGKVMPALTCIFPFAYWKPRVLYWVCALRTLILIPAFLMWTHDEMVLWSSFTWQMIFMFLIAWSHGWVGATALVTAPALCHDEKKRGAVAALSILAVPFGVGAGMVLTKLLALAIE